MLEKSYVLSRMAEYELKNKDKIIIVGYFWMTKPAIDMKYIKVYDAIDAEDDEALEKALGEISQYNKKAEKEEERETEADKLQAATDFAKDAAAEEAVAV